MFRSSSLFLLWLAVLCGLTAFSAAQPAEAPRTPRGVIKVGRIVGEVTVTDLATSLRARLGPNSLVVDGQVVETGPNASVVLVLSNGAVVNLRGDSRLEVSQFLQNPFSSAYRVSEATAEPSTSQTRLLLRKGEIISQVKKLNREAGSSFTVETAVGAAGIRGTAFRIRFDRTGAAGRFVLSMAEGLIQFVPAQGRPVEVAAGRQLGFTAQFQAAGERVESMPATLATAEVGAADFAGLQGVVAETVGAAVNVQFTPLAQTSPGGFSVAAAGTPTAEEPFLSAAPEPEVAAPGTGALASPAPLPPPSRVTPADGE